MGRLGENCYSRAMATNGSRSAKTPEGSTASPPAVRRIAGGETWSVTEIICSAGPGDRPYEERHQGFSISAVLQGCFTYRSDRGESLLYPGALLLGANRSCYECGHEHSAGDRCISFNVREDAFEDIASIASSRRNNPLSRPMLPASNRLAPLFAAIERVQDCVSPLKAEELLIVLFEAVVAALNDGVRSPPAPAGWEVRRIVEVLRSIEEHPDEALDLAGLAAIAGLGKHHFLRIFRRSVGMTPYQYVLRVRMGRAARRLATSKDPVLAVALDSGFGDLSTFNARFRATFGMTPSKYRAVC
jgi:AraC family transcriptional regulator